MFYVRYGCKTWLIEIGKFIYAHRNKYTQIIAKSVLKRKVVITNLYTCKIFLNIHINSSSMRFLNERIVYDSAMIKIRF